MPIKNRLSDEALDVIIEEIGDKILARFSAEERIAGLSPEELIRALTPERISALSSEQRRQLQQLLEQ